MVQTQETERQTLSVPEAAKMLGIAEITMWKHLGKGRIRSIKVGGRRLIPKRVIEDLLNGTQPEERDDD